MATFIHELQTLIQDRQKNLKDGSYTSDLFKHGIDRILRKVGEESGEFIIASKNGDANEITAECADLIYHVLVALTQSGVSFSEVEKELSSRHK